MEMEFFRQIVEDWAKAIPYSLRIYLYGSVAKGIANEKSDIDIALEFPQLEENQRTLIIFDYQELWETELSNKLGKKVHIELFDDKTPTIKKGLEESSVLLFDNILGKNEC